MGNNKNRRAQTPKPRNENWMRANLEHASRNNTIPSKAKYSRKDRRDNSYKNGY